MSKEELETKIEEAEASFKTLCLTNKLKYKSVKFYAAQYFFFMGVMSMLKEKERPVKWQICLMVNREIIEDYTKELK